VVLKSRSKPTREARFERTDGTTADSGNVFSMPVNDINDSAALAVVSAFAGTH